MEDNGGFFDGSRVTKSRPSLKRILYLFRVFSFLEQILFLSAVYTVDFLHLEYRMTIAFSFRTRRFPLIHVETFSWYLRAKALRNKFHEVVLHGETLGFFFTGATVASRCRSRKRFYFSWNLSRNVWKLEKLSRNRLCYTVQRLLKLFTQRRCTRVSAKSFNV